VAEVGQTGVREGGGAVGGDVDLAAAGPGLEEGCEGRGRGDFAGGLLEVAEGEDEGYSVWGGVGVGVEVPWWGLFMLVLGGCGLLVLMVVGCGPVRPG
jgi:hypothetical protein